LRSRNVCRAALCRAKKMSLGAGSFLHCRKCQLPPDAEASSELEKQTQNEILKIFEVTNGSQAHAEKPKVFSACLFVWSRLSFLISHRSKTKLPRGMFSHLRGSFFFNPKKALGKPIAPISPR
ncbi:MAG: hypothetical protein AAB354_16995, partial [candidate division KSB1 bacterium]